MSWTQLQLGSIVDATKATLSLNIFKKLSRCTACIIGSCFGSIIRFQKSIAIRRMRCRRKKLDIHKNKRKDSNRRVCGCKTCTLHRAVRRERVLSCDYLTNLAYNHRVRKMKHIQRPATDCVSRDPIDVSSSALDRVRSQDHRDVSNYTSDQTEGWAWWTKMQEAAARMPPLKQPTKYPLTNTDNFSDISNIESDTASDESVVQQFLPKSLMCQETATMTMQPREDLASDSKIESNPEKKTSLNIAEKASTKTTLKKTGRRRGNLSLVG